MRDLNFQDSGCEPKPFGRGAVVSIARRGARSLLRPTFARLAQLLEGVVGRLDRAEAAIDVGDKTIRNSEARLDSAEWSAAVLHNRAEGFCAHLNALNDEFLALRDDVRRFQAADGPRFEAAEDRLGAAEGRLGAAEGRLVAAEANDAVLWKKSDGLAAHLAGLNDEFLALRDEVRQLPDPRPRLDSAEWKLGVLDTRTDGLAEHLAGLSDDHRALHAEVQARIVQLSALSDAIHNHGRRGDEIETKLSDVVSLHWDHVALARRLAVIEDLLSVPSNGENGEAPPLIAFPGFEGGDQARAG